MASTRLTRTVQSGGNRAKWTWSAWVKRSNLGATQTLFAAHADSNNKTRLEIAADDELYFNDESGGNTNGRIVSTQKFRDVSGWYHIVAVWDKDNSTSGDRILYYVNGTRITSFSDTGNAPSGNSTMNNSSVTHEIGSENSGNYFSGYMSHIHFCDGYAYAASDFGEADSNGVWKIKTSPSVSYGTTGYFILKDGNSVTDQSGNSNNWTVSGGTLTDDKDNPSNVFSTIDYISTHASDYTFANRNNKVSNSNGSTRITRGTLGASSGKYYFETKIATVGGSGGFGTGLYVGVTDAEYFENLGTSQAFIGTGSNQVAQRGDGNHLAKNNTQINGYESCSAGSILRVALDLDNGYVYFGVNATWGNSGDPTSGATGTGGVSITTGKTYMFGASGYNGWSVETNFGNGYFGTTQISSEGTNASGNGVFEYDVPTGYTALCTKGLDS